jgi:hypothetical protein
MKAKKIFMTEAALLWLCGAALAENLILNGSFEDGTNGFRSDYTYDNGPTGLYPEGNYAVVTSASDVHPDFVTAYDYTYGDWNGSYLVANGAPDITKAVWQSLNPIHVAESGTAYRFEAYIMTCVPVDDNAPSLRFQVGNGTQWADMGHTFTFENGAAVGEWNLSYADGIFGAAGDYYVRLLNDSSVEGGNDFGLDNLFFDLRANAPSFPTNPGSSPVDISVPAVPEPASALMIAFGGGLIALYRRFFGRV